LLSPFIPSRDLVAIFHKDLLKDASLWPIAMALLGKSGTKPFDCVGTEEEMFVALGLAAQSYTDAGKPLPVILRRFKEAMNPASRDIQKRATKLLRSWDTKNFLPPEIKTVLRNRLK
jgi:hypothetical protein